MTVQRRCSAYRPAVRYTVSLPSHTPVRWTCTVIHEAVASVSDQVERPEHSQGGQGGEADALSFRWREICGSPCCGGTNQSLRPSHRIAPSLHCAVTVYPHSHCTVQSPHSTISAPYGQHSHWSLLCHDEPCEPDGTPVATEQSPGPPSVYWAVTAYSYGLYIVMASVYWAVTAYSYGLYSDGQCVLGSHSSATVPPLRTAAIGLHHCILYRYHMASSL